MIRTISLTFVATLVFLMLVTGGQASLEQNLVLYLDFDKEAEEVVKDLSPAGNDAAIFGNVKWVKGIYGLALEFGEEQVRVNPQNEEAQRLFIEDTPSLDFNNQPFTIAAWVNIETIKGVEDVGSETVIINKKVGFNDNFADYAIFINRGGAGVVQFCIGDMTACHRILFRKTISANEWYHLAITFDPDSDEVNYYLNGILEQTVATQIEPVADEETPVYIGVQPIVGEICRFFNGKMDDLAVFNRVLTEGEVKNVMGGNILSVSPSGSLTTTWGWLRTAK